MENIESKQGKIAASAETVYNFLSDLRNLDDLIPEDKVQDWSSTEDSCSFSVPQAGSIQLKLTDKEPFKLIRVEPEGSGPMGMGFSLYIQILEVGDLDTRIKLTFRAEMNTMVKMMVAGPLKKGLDQIIDTIGDIRINPSDQ